MPWRVVADSNVLLRPSPDPRRRRGFPDVPPDNLSAFRGPGARAAASGRLVRRTAASASLGRRSPHHTHPSSSPMSPMATFQRGMLDAIREHKTVAGTDSPGLGCGKNLTMKSMKGMKRDFSQLSNRVIGCAIEVHRMLGPGLLESAYQQCLARELSLNGIDFELEHPLPVNYKGVRLDCGYRVDVLVEKELILELKSVDAISGIHQAQLLTYMKLAGVKQGLLINFNAERLKDGLQSFVL